MVEKDNQVYFAKMMEIQSISVRGYDLRSEKQVVMIFSFAVFVSTTIFWLTQWGDIGAEAGEGSVVGLVFGILPAGLTILEFASSSHSSFSMPLNEEDRGALKLYCSYPQSLNHDQLEHLMTRRNQKEIRWLGEAP